MKDNLKNCPFCDGEGKLETMLYGGTAVSCQNTDCGFYGYNVETSMWNTRPNDAKWISVIAFPEFKMGEQVIFYDGHIVYTGRWDTEEQHKSPLGGYPTHVMPLPAPPKQSSEGE